jgi:hypothetical protein
LRLWLYCLASLWVAVNLWLLQGIKYLRDHWVTSYITLLFAKTQFLFFFVSSAVRVLYYLLNTSIIIFFFVLARKWKFIMGIWLDKELVFLRKPYYIEKWSLKHKINLVSVLFIFFTGSCKLLITTSNK